ncbi:glutamyl-tRNA synthetase [Gaeumannomyces tritici R3-111a-1]|uniref:Glutamate--tRNA ligase, mitochondrial n=1 Tax=Gaeumannomyces tritici (strain R3-111a-1) TaxID=644352 RepID=J3NIG0_GAET3|nr:glutamyl-tRNA synthetase [Gaeumannomyces tritici R3-111a-1]EJT81053.1 glutamyl-tRNA synthetase [Gaeumannomyces tritici R3-111a-1]
MLFRQGPRRPLFLGRSVWIGHLLASRGYRTSKAASALTSSTNGAKSDDESRPARTRFAPSPTGFLHMGSLRTALFNYLLARSTGGQFLLRLEDTDRTRIVPDAEKRLYEDLRWAGLSWDEGPDIGGPKGPYRQSERLHHYRKYAQELLDKDRAYRCFCTKEELEASQLDSQAESGHTGRYPGTCLAVTADESEERAARGEPHVIRFKSSKKPVLVQDVVYRRFKKRGAEDDFIIMKSDGFPTYHFANVVDDYLMEVTHVVRGAEWLVSTPMHCDLYAALGWKEPVFAHVGLLVNAERQKLSKRNSDIQISSYQEKHILPEALLNFLVTLGWRAPSRKGIMTLQQLVECFNLKFTKGDIVTELEKLEFYQRKHLERLLTEPPADHQPDPRLPDPRLPDPKLLDPRLEPVLRAVADEIRALEASRTGGNSSEFPEPPNSPAPIDTAPLGSLHPAVEDDLEAAGGRQEYVLAALRLLAHKAWPLEGLVAANRYIFWRPSRAHLLETLGQLREALGEVEVVADGSADGVRVALASARRALEPLDHEMSWTADRLGEVIEFVNDSVVCHEPGTGLPIAHATFKLWRWAMAGLDPGPPIHALLELLGREEALARLDQAIELAAEAGWG